LTQHIDRLGVSFVGYALFTFVICALCAVFIAVLPAIDPEAPAALMMGIAAFTMGLGVVLAVPYTAVGIGLGRRVWWARGAALALGVLSMSSAPFGTALGMYSFVTLLDADVAAEFTG